MSKVRYIIIAITCCILALFAFGNYNAFGSWIYHEAAPSEFNLDLAVVVAPWEGAEDLEGSTEEGTNQKALIERILNGVSYDSSGNEIGVGLNAKDSYLAEQIQSRENYYWRDVDQLGSMDVWEDDTINNFFELSEATNNVSFILEFPDETPNTYYLYTTTIELGGRWNPTIPIGDTVFPVYRTTIVFNEETTKWEATITEEGYAPSAYYKNPLTGLQLDPAFDTSNWNPGQYGSTIDTALEYTFGSNLSIELTEIHSKKVYKVKEANRARSRTFTVTGDATINVYDSNGALVKNPSAGAQGTNTLKFNTKANATYYIEVIGTSQTTLTTS